jgi:hypothetical protein
MLIRAVLEWLFSFKKKSILQVLTYSASNLAESLKNKYTSVEVILKKNHYSYLKNYFGHSDINARTIVIEEKYISKDFLHDYAAYYSLCFEEYPKFCKRVHFFNIEFSESDLKEKITQTNLDNSEFWKSYLGFIVVKPIPVTILGFTVLKTFSHNEGFNARNFWGIRDYSIHIFGNNISLKSLAFQEQDSVLAACATTAIWSMLNKASIDFHTILKSPSQITQDASDVSYDGSRLFPNKGLDLLQICQAIFNSGLVSEVKQADIQIMNSTRGSTRRYISNSYLKKILNAYSTIGIPIILVIDVPNENSYGLHAITVSGFSMINPTIGLPQNEISWMSDNLTKFYAHDDQWGPFARIEFNGLGELITPWTSASTKPTYTTNIIVPLYPKIRISYEDIEVIVIGLDTIFSLLFKDQIKFDLTWDIKVDFSENFKSMIKGSNLGNIEKLKILTKSLPKYLWIVKCYIGENIILILTFDATDVRNGMIGSDLINFMPSSMTNSLKNYLILNQPLFQNLLNHNSSSSYYQFLIDKL